MPLGAVGAIGAAGTGARGGTGGAVRIPTGSGTELAAEEISNPPAPAAPRRNISRRFNDIHPLQELKQ